jgi:hypothetical protein
MWMIYMKGEEVSRAAEKWSVEWLGLGLFSGDSNINDRSLFASQLGSISGNNNRGRSRYAERTKEAAWQAFLYVMPTL